MRNTKFNPLGQITNKLGTMATQDYNKMARMGVPAYQRSQDAEKAAAYKQALLNMSQEDETRMDNIRKDAQQTRIEPRRATKGQLVATGKRAFENLKQYRGNAIVEQAIAEQEGQDEIIARSIANAIQSIINK